MRSPFAPIALWFSQALAALQAGVVALELIQARVNGIWSAINDLEFPVAPQGEAMGDPRADSLEQQIRDLTVAVDEGIRRVQRSENRVRQIVKGARRELREAGFEHAGVEAEAEGLLEVNADDRDGERVPEMPEDVVPAQEVYSPVPGVTVRQMQIARARRTR